MILKIPILLDLPVFFILLQCAVLEMDLTKDVELTTANGSGVVHPYFREGPVPTGIILENPPTFKIPLQEE